jgi:hypothetical protein
MMVVAVLHEKLYIVFVRALRWSSPVTWKGLTLPLAVFRRGSLTHSVTEPDPNATKQGHI